MPTTNRSPWTRDGAGYRADMPNEITLFATPDYTKDFGAAPKRGTTWRAGVSHWDESTRTVSRFGRDEYGVLHKSYKDAMRAAESIYRDEQSTRLPKGE